MSTYEERAQIAESRVRTLIAILKWYIENDDTYEGGKWDIENAYWIKGKREAERLVKMIDPNNDIGAFKPDGEVLVTRPKI